MPSNHHLQWPHEIQFIMLMLSFVQICLPIWLQESPPTMMVILSSILDLEIKHVSCKHMSTSLYKQKYSKKQDATGRVWRRCLQLSLSYPKQYLQDDEELNHPPTTKKLCISSPSD
jgi:hypothetical protein